jgi:hypothetical protein
LNVTLPGVAVIVGVGPVVEQTGFDLERIVAPSAGPVVMLVLAGSEPPGSDAVGRGVDEGALDVDGADGGGTFQLQLAVTFAVVGCTCKTGPLAATEVEPTTRWEAPVAVVAVPGTSIRPNWNSATGHEKFAGSFAFRQTALALGHQPGGLVYV